MITTTLPKQRRVPELDLSNNAEQWETAGAPPAEYTLKGKRAVVVEDEGITQLQIRAILRDKGVEVVGAAANGVDAVELVLRTQPDFILMDVRMPRMDGLEAARRLTAQGRYCIVLLTAFPEDSLRGEAHNAGACGYILKPVTSDTLIPQLRAILDAWQRKQE